MIGKQLSEETESGLDQTAQCESGLNEPRGIVPVETDRVPLPVVQLHPALHADQHAFFADLHQGDAVHQGQDEPVLSVFSVSIENQTFGVICPKLEGRLDAAQTKR